MYYQVQIWKPFNIVKLLVFQQRLLNTDWKEVQKDYKKNKI